MVTRAKFVAPAAAPNQCSAAVSARTSFSMTVGSPVRSWISRPTGTFSQPRNGDRVTTWDCGSTGPARLIPTVATNGSAASSVSTASAIWSIAAWTDPAGSPMVRWASTVLRMSVRTRLISPARSLMPMR